MIEHFEHNIHVITEIFDFGPLLGIYYVLKNERMKAKIFPNLLDNIDLMDTVDVDPGDRGCVFKRKTFLDIFDFLFLALLLVIIQD